MNKVVGEHFSNINLDLRKKVSGYSRFMDQKVTPDVLSFISDCILNINLSNFTVRDIWESDYFEKNIKAIYGKPAPSNKSAHSEYNKFIGQPLKTLSYARVLDEERVGTTNLYSVLNENLLSYIALNERGAFDFLCEYIIKVMEESGFALSLMKYKEELAQGESKPESLQNLKDQFHKFMLGNTEIKGSFEINRIFPKILNIFAVKHNIPGIEKGRMTKFPFTFSDLMYNRTNFRDLRKGKSVSRQEASINTEEFVQNENYLNYTVQKVMQIIKRKYDSGEVKDQWSKGNATYVHHIFPRAQYPLFAAFPENLIKLTPEQHYGHAHPNAHTNAVNFDYQIQCLLSKSASIEESLSKGEYLYSKANFSLLINNCLKLDITTTDTFNDIRTKLLNLQSTA